MKNVCASSSHLLLPSFVYPVFKIMPFASKALEQDEHNQHNSTWVTLKNIPPKTFHINYNL